MVTASHNPKADNGFKIYSSNGCQIIPPHDTGISHHIALNLAPWNLSPRYQYDDSSVLDHALSEDVTAKVTESYYKSLESLCYRGKATNATSTVRVAYTGVIAFSLFPTYHSFLYYCFVYVYFFYIYSITSYISNKPCAL